MHNILSDPTALSAQRKRDFTTCRKCESTETQSFPMVYQNGTSVSNMSGAMYNPNTGISVAGGSMKNQSLLAKQVAPPTEPDTFSEMIAGMILALVFGVLVFLIFQNLTGILIGFGILGIFSVGIYFYGNKGYSKKIEDHNKAMADWSRRWMCLKCGAQWRK